MKLLSLGIFDRLVKPPFLPFLKYEKSRATAIRIIRVVTIFKASKAFKINRKIIPKEIDPDKIRKLKKIFKLSVIAKKRETKKESS